jgi:hypothetical protein
MPGRLLKIILIRELLEGPKMNLMGLEKGQFITSGKLSMQTLRFLSKKTTLITIIGYHLKIISCIIQDLAMETLRGKRKKNI